MSQKIVEIDLGPVVKDIVENRRYHEWIPIGHFDLEVSCTTPAHPAGNMKIRRAGARALRLPTRDDYELLDGEGAMYIMSIEWPKLSICGQSDQKWWKIDMKEASTD